MNGDLLAVKPVPPHLHEKPWFNRRIRHPRDYLGITRIDERIRKLSWLVVVLTTYGFPNRRFLRDVNRLSVDWWKTSFDNMRKRVNYLTREVGRSLGRKLAPSGCRQRSTYPKPRVCGEKFHVSHGITVPIFGTSPPVKKV
jgi:hypothetical protein